MSRNDMLGDNQVRPINDDSAVTTDFYARRKGGRGLPGRFYRMHTDEGEQFMEKMQNSKKA